MLYVPGPSWGFSWNNYTGQAGSAQLGHTVTGNASANTKSSWQEVAGSSEITKDCYWIWISANYFSASTVDTSCLLDVAVDPSGGTTFDTNIRLNNLMFGHSNIWYAYLQHVSFPLLIPAGSSVAVRHQTPQTSKDIYVAVKFYGAPKRPEVAFAGRYSETLGADLTNSTGVEHTPGNHANYSTWASLGTTTNACSFWRLMVQRSSGTVGSRYYYLDLGVGDGTNMLHIVRDMLFHTEGTERVNLIGETIPTFCDVPTGATLYVRGKAAASAEELNVVAVGVG